MQQGWGSPGATVDCSGASRLAWPSSPRSTSTSGRPARLPKVSQGCSGHSEAQVRGGRGAVPGHVLLARPRGWLRRHLRPLGRAGRGFPPPPFASCGVVIFGCGQEKQAALQAASLPGSPRPALFFFHRLRRVASCKVAYLKAAGGGGGRKLLNRGNKKIAVARESSPSESVRPPGGAFLLHCTQTTCGALLLAARS